MVLDDKSRLMRIKSFNLVVACLALNVALKITLVGWASRLSVAAFPVGPTRKLITLF
jgi:hypothetical protein